MPANRPLCRTATPCVLECGAPANYKDMHPSPKVFQEVGSMDSAVSQQIHHERLLRMCHTGVACIFKHEMGRSVVAEWDCVSKPLTSPCTRSGGRTLSPSGGYFSEETCEAGGRLGSHLDQSSQSSVGTEAQGWTQTGLETWLLAGGPGAELESITS